MTSHAKVCCKNGKLGLEALNKTLYSMFLLIVIEVFENDNIIKNIYFNQVHVIHVHVVSICNCDT